jgi:hypothetical protein
MKRKHLHLEANGPDATGASRIVVLPEVLKKSKSYIELPAVLRLSKSAKDQWFSFHDQKYHPLGLVDKDGNKLYPAVEITVNIAVKNDTSYESRETTVPPSSDSVCWLRSIKSHIKKTIVVKAFCKEDASIQPLIQEIRVLDDNEFAAWNEGDERKQQEKDSHKALIQSDINIIDTSFPFRPLAPSELLEVLKETPGKGFDLQFRKYFRKEDVEAFVQEIRQPPIIEPVGTRARLDQPICTVTSPKPVQSVPFKGPLLEVVLPRTLLTALYNDQFIISPTFSAYSHSQTANDLRTKSPIESNFQFAKQPTVAAVFDALSEKSPSHPNTKEVIRFMKYHFESVFSQHLLYPEETNYLVPLIQSLEKERKLLANELGPIYLLRYLVFLVCSVNPSGTT